METILNTEKYDYETFYKALMQTKELIEKVSLETEMKLQNTDRILTEKFQETDRKFQEYQKEMRRIEGNFNSRWGQFVEVLIDGIIVDLLKKRGIYVETTTTRQKRFHKNRQYEIDIIAINRTELVAVEVKSTLKIEDVKEFLEVLKEFKEVFPIYKDMLVYGGVAYLNIAEQSDVYAEKNGLFVIKAVGESARITNNKLFKPKLW